MLKRKEKGVKIYKSNQRELKAPQKKIKYINKYEITKEGGKINISA